MSKIQEQLENLDKRIKQAAEKQNKWKQELLKIQKLKDNLEGQNLFKQKKKIGSLNYQKYLVLGRAILENYEYNLVDTPKEIYDKIFQIANTLITNNEDRKLFGFNELSEEFIKDQNDKIKNLKNQRILEQQKSNNSNQNSNNYQVENSTENQQNLPTKKRKYTNHKNDANAENNNNTNSENYNKE